jgi:glutamine amidotransferase
MIAIVDYGMGNLRSVQKALEKVGADARITNKSLEIKRADKVVLPGVGAMAPAMDKLRQLGLTETIREVITAGKPFLGICLGMQLLFEKSAEGGNVEGLHILKGTVERFTQGKVPHMGWNQVKIQPAGAVLYQGVNDGRDVYFCHSYYVVPKDPKITASITEYGIPYASSVAAKNVWGVQFHPEKSQSVGLRILKNFAEVKT